MTEFILLHGLLRILVIYLDSYQFRLLMVKIYTLGVIAVHDIPWHLATHQTRVEAPTSASEALRNHRAVTLSLVLYWTVQPLESSITAVSITLKSARVLEYTLNPATKQSDFLHAFSSPCPYIIHLSDGSLGLSWAALRIIFPCPFSIP